MGKHSQRDFRELRVVALVFGLGLSGLGLGFPIQLIIPCLALLQPSDKARPLAFISSIGGSLLQDSRPQPTNLKQDPETSPSNLQERLGLRQSFENHLDTAQTLGWH